MSRSYKKHPILKDNGKSKKYGKQLANRKVRHSELSGGKSNDYKKCYESWDVYDFRFYCDRGLDMTKEQLERWAKWCHRK